MEILVTIDAIYRKKTEMHRNEWHIRWGKERLNLGKEMIEKIVLCINLKQFLDQGAARSLLYS